MSNWLYEVGCCGLNAALGLLESAGHPEPTLSSVLSHPPVLDCDCDALFVTPGPSVPIDRSGLDYTTAAVTFQHPGQRGPNGYTAQFEVHLTRCVHVTNPLASDEACWDTGDCAAVIESACAGELEPRSGDPCAPHVDKATEAWWLLAERWLLETELAKAWRCCLDEGWCQPDDRAGCATSIEWVSTTVHDSGGCGGVILTFQAGR